MLRTLVVALKLASRLALLAGALHFTTASPRFVIAITAAFSALFAAQSVVRAFIQRDARRSIIATLGRSLLSADVLRASANGEQDTEFAVYEGFYLSERLISSITPDLIAEALASVAVALIVATTLPARLLGLGFAAVIVGALGVGAARRITSRVERSIAGDHHAFVDALSATIRGRLDIVAAGRDRDLLERLDDATRRWTAASMRADRISSLAGRAPMLGAAIGAGLVVALDQLSNGGALTLEALGRGAVLASAVPPFAGLARSAIELAKTRAQLKAFNDLLALPARVTGGSTPVPTLPAALSFDEVRFTYALGSKAALNGCSFSWSPPGLLAFAGPNGSGKSTCLRLLLGLAPVESGHVLLGGVPVLSLDLVAWRRRCAYLPQRPYLPERATVREAMQLLAPDAGDEALLDALLRVEVIEPLTLAKPDAPLDVTIGTLSTGQRQRVAIARALAQDAAVLLFDEPDANLDVAGVTRVVRLLEEAAKTKLVVVAAHTEELVRAADRVVRLSQGRALDGDA